MLLLFLLTIFLFYRFVVVINLLCLKSLKENKTFIKITCAKMRKEVKNSFLDDTDILTLYICVTYELTAVSMQSPIERRNVLVSP